MTGIETYALTPFISLTMLIPLAGAVLLALVPGRHGAAHRGLAFVVSVLAFACSLSVWVNFDPARAGFQLVEDRAWLPFGARYTVGVDGISLLLFMLTTFLTPLAILGAFSAIRKRAKEFYIAMLLLEVAMLGTLVAADMLLFYLFWEFMLIPMYLIIGVWGGERRVYAAVKFFLFTFLGSVLMLVGIIWMHLKAGGGSFALVDFLKLDLGFREQAWLFAAFGLAFAIKVPMFPFHTWLPDAHVEAPTAGSVILAGVLLKMGTYGFIRFAIPLFPDAAGAFAVPVMVLAVVGIVYGSLCSFAQGDVKKLVAYSSVAHLGFVMLGMFALTQEAVEGAILQMVNHGISTGALFMLVGVLYERRHTRAIDAYGGIARVMKVYAALLVIVTLSSIGLPGTNGFVGEFLILAGTFREALSGGGAFRAIGLALGIAAATGVVLGAVYMLTMVRKVLFGPIVHEENRALKDVSFREFAVLGALVVMVFWIGVYPSFFLSRTTASVRATLDAYKGRMVEQRTALLRGVDARAEDARAAPSPWRVAAQEVAR
ncbi:MAG: NADH-quinone oxidoreductase subunit M [Deltaproteobacteria bacterium]|nr:NADH-quinone oxidoreductase subunit M [Deltaproteobacteria bacterium]